MSAGSKHGERLAGLGRFGTGSVRFRITLVATVAVAAVLGAASLGLLAVHRHSLTRSLEETLTQQSDAITLSVRSVSLPGTLVVSGDDDAVAQAITADGTVLAATANVAGDPPMAAPPPRAGERSTTSVDGLLEGGDSFLVVSRAIDGPTGPVVVHVGAPLDDIDDSTAALRRSLGGGVPLILLLLAALVWWLVGRTLRPVEAIRAGVSEIGGSGLHQRVPVPPGDDEVARLARTMNAMLERVETASDRQQRFVADASHELRSPLTRIRSELEVDLAHPGGADPEATHHSVLEEVDGLQRLVEDLLLLARSDGEAPGVPPTIVDLDDLVLDEAHRVADGLRVDSAGVGPSRVRGDARELGRAVRNVIENAARHGVSQVTVTLVSGDGLAVLTIADDGPGVPTDRVDEVFERFTRLDPARTGAAGGTGLGLAIAKDVVERHGGTISVDGAYAPGACFVITLPLADA